METEKVWVLKITIADEVQRQITIAFLADEEEIVAIEETDSGLTIYHDNKSVLDNALQLLTENLPFELESQELFTIDNKNWNAEWESSFQPIQVEDFCLIKSSFHDIASEGMIEIIIDPEMAFGTGHHETTYLMIQVMRELSFSNKKILDYGSGTAILAILAEKLGATDIVAIDYDQQATDCAGACISLNNCSHIKLLTGEIADVPPAEYKIILANINRNVLLASAAELASLQSPNDQLLLSGILEQDFDIITTTFSDAGYQLSQKAQRGEWLCLLLVRV